MQKQNELTSAVEQGIEELLQSPSLETILGAENVRTLSDARYNKSWRKARNAEIEAIGKATGCSLFMACVVCELRADAAAYRQSAAITAAAESLIGLVYSLCGGPVSREDAVRRFVNLYDDMPEDYRRPAGKKFRKYFTAEKSQRVTAPILEELYDALMIPESDWM